MCEAAFLSGSLEATSDSSGGDSSEHAPVTLPRKVRAETSQLPACRQRNLHVSLVCGAITAKSSLFSCMRSADVSECEGLRV